MRVSLSRPATGIKAPIVPGWLRYALIGISLIVIWQLYVSLSGVNPLLVASPLSTINALITDTVNGQLPGAMLVSLQNLAIGMGIGIIIGIFAFR